MTHAWCKDVARDERVRAAEDGRTAPLPTLKECIAAPFRRDTCRMCHGAGFVAERGTRGWFICDLCNGTGGVPRTASASSAVEHENKANGMRTERVTLEFEVERGPSPSEWPWSYILSRSDALKMRPGESVRVVRDEEREEFPSACPIAGGTVVVNGEDMVTLSEFLRHTTRLTQEAGAAKRERDAAIRERDELRKQVVAIKEQSHDRWRSMNNALCELSKVRSERDALQARVAELEAASGGGERAE